jgi:hypothetical protein
MPAYVASPFKPPVKLLVAGTPEYLWGSYNDKTGDTLGYVISNSAVTTTGTLVFRIVSGNVPVTGSKITVVGCGNSANFNVTNATVTVVSVTEAGIATVTYPITSTTQASSPDGGQVSIPQPEVGEALAAGASAPVALASINAILNQEHVVTAVVSFPSLPTSVTITLQQAVIDLNSEYADIATVATVAGGVVTVGGQVTIDPVMGRFLRFSNGTVTGGSSPKIVAKLIA